MNHLESAFTGKNSSGDMLVMIVAVLVAANIIGAIPLIIVMSVRIGFKP